MRENIWISRILATMSPWLWKATKKNKANAWRRPATMQREAPANRPSYSGPMCVTVMRIRGYFTRVGRASRFGVPPQKPCAEDACARLSTEFLRSHGRPRWPSCADNPMTRAERKLYPGGNTLVALPIHLAFSLSAHCGKQSVK